MENSFENVAVSTGMELAIQQQAAPPTALSGSDQARAIAEVQAALVIAQSRPRNELRSRDRILQACQRTSLAQGAIYSYPRGGTQISGPSIRLAEVAARSWGNLTYGFRELNRRHGESEVEAFAWDLESNTRAIRQFAVRHARDKGNSVVEVTQERDIYEVLANQAQRRVRSCILEIIPGDIIEEAVEQCERTLKAAVGGKDPKELAKVIADMASAFEGIGVPKAAIEKRLGHRLEATQPGEVIGLRKIYSTIRDGFSTPAEWFKYEGEEVAESSEEAFLTHSSTQPPKRTRRTAAQMEADRKAAETPEPTDFTPPGLTIGAPPEGARFVTCPMNSDQVDVTYCESDCQQREGCPSH